MSFSFADSSEVQGISYMGAAIVAAKLLEKSKNGKKGSESAGSKIARYNFRGRIDSIFEVLNNNGGPTELAMQALKDDYSFFTDIDNATLIAWIKDTLCEFEGTNYVRMPPGFQGNLKFNQNSDECDESTDEECENEEKEE
jgi:hypothetical protein